MQNYIDLQPYEALMSTEKYISFCQNYNIGQAKIQEKFKSLVNSLSNYYSICMIKADMILSNEYFDEVAFSEIVLEFSKKPTEQEMKDMLNKRNNILKALGYTMNSDGKVSDQNRNLIAYYKLKNGQILKIDRQHYTCYIFNIQLQLWQEDSVLFDEFQNGNLDGHELDFKENYSIGEPIRKRRLL